MLVHNVVISLLLSISRNTNSKLSNLGTVAVDVVGAAHEVEGCSADVRVERKGLD
ncbi:hypothetical protein DsansV1_C13g0117701 [Dioscorea sansibarensis]